MKCRDDEALDRGIEEGCEPKTSHSGQEHPVIGGIAAALRSDPALLVQLSQRVVKGKDRVSRQGESKLADGLEPLELIQEVQAQAASIATRCLQGSPTRNDEAETRHTLKTLIGRGYHVVDTCRSQIDWNRTEAAHRVHNEASMISLHNLSNRLERVQDACGCLAVDQGDMSDRRIFKQEAFHLLGNRDCVFLASQHTMNDSQVGRDLDDSLAIGTVGENQQPALWRDHRGDY